jgi:hypothetical protein
MVAAKIGVAGDSKGSEIAVTIDRAESLVRDAVPAARVIYLEPDIQR